MDPSRITLRPIKPSDAHDMLSWASDERVMKSVRWKALSTKEEARIFIDEISGPHRWGRLICIDDRSIGLVTVYVGSGNERCRGEMSYAIGVEHWGKGVATVAVKMAVPKVFEAFPQILRLQAMTTSENKASQRVLVKAGFTKEAQLMDRSRITLRPFKPSDADDLLTWAGDDRVTKYGRWKTLETKEEALVFIDQLCIPHPWRRSICVDDRSVGFVSALPGSGDERCRADMGYAVAVGNWGKGIATAAVKMAVTQVFDEFSQLRRVQAFVNVENTASQRVVEKAGFTKDGLMRKYFYLKGEIQDVFVFSILSPDSDSD